MGALLDAFIEAKRREVEAATEEMFKNLSWPTMWLDPPYSKSDDLADAAPYAMRFYPVITNANYGFASDLFGDKMENKTQTGKFFVVYNNTTKYSCSRTNTKEAATAEAERLAKQYPGYEYVVMEALSVSYVTPAPSITRSL